MTVKIQPGFYRWNGALTAYAGETTSSLSGYVPAGVNTIHFIVICLDRASNSYTIVDGTDIIAVTPSTAVEQSDITALTFNEDYYPLAAVRFYNGQTRIVAQDIIFDVRLWAGERFQAPAAQLDNIMIDAEGNMMIDADSNIMYGAG